MTSTHNCTCNRLNRLQLLLTITYVWLIADLKEEKSSKRKCTYKLITSLLRPQTCTCKELYTSRPYPEHKTPASP